jgi:hypothetical protein
VQKYGLNSSCPNGFLDWSVSFEIGFHAKPQSSQSSKETLRVALFFAVLREIFFRKY